MSDDRSTDRREFLRRLALTTVYAAPVIRELATPPELSAGGQGKGFNTEKGGTMTGGGGTGTGAAQSIGDSFVAPWQME